MNTEGPINPKDVEVVPLDGAQLSASTEDTVRRVGAEAFSQAIAGAHQADNLVVVNFAARSRTADAHELASNEAAPVIDLSARRQQRWRK